MANLFIKMLEKFCQGTVFVQAKARGKAAGKKKQRQRKAQPKKQAEGEMSEIDKVGRLLFLFAGWSGW